METREVIKDVNAQRTKVQQPNTVPLAPVYSPVPSSVSKVGDELRQLGGAFRGVGEFIEKYDEKKRDEGTVEGEIMRRQGKTLEEAKKAGDYIGTGWQIADIQIQADEMIMAEQQRIETQMYDMPPADYAKHLQEISSTLLNMPVEDKVLKKHINERVKDMSGRLASSQMEANMKYNYKKTLDAIPRMINSTLGAARTPEEYADAQVDAMEMMNPKNFNLKPEDHMNMMEGIILYRQNEYGDEHIGRMFAESLAHDFPDTAKVVEYAQSVGDPAFAMALADTESSNRNVNEDGTLVEGPIVLNEDGTPRMFNGKEDRARGRYQTMRSTFHDPATRAMLGFEGEGNFDDAKEVEEFGKKYLDYNTIKQKGIPELIAASHVSGHNFVDNWVKRIGLDPRKGEISPMEFLQIAGANSTTETGKRAYKERWNYVQSVMQNYDKRRPQTAAELQKLMPKSLIPSSKFSALNNSYTEMQERKINKYMVDDAIRQGTIQNLPNTELQQTALNQMYVDMRAQTEEENPPLPGESQEQYASRVEKQHFLKYVPKLKASGLVDEKLSTHLKNTLSLQNVSQGDAINPLAIEALQELEIIRNNSNEKYMMNYVNPENEGFVLRALSNLQGGKEPAEALKRSVMVEQNKDRTKDVPVSAGIQKNIDTEINKLVDSAQMSWWEKVLPDFFQSRPHADDPDTAMTKEELAAGFTKSLNGQRVMTELKTRANMYMPDIQNEAGAVAKAFADIQGRTQIIMGQPVLLDNQSWDSFFGFKDGHLAERQNVLHQAIAEEFADQADYPWYAGIAHDLKRANNATIKVVQSAMRGTAQALPENMSGELQQAADSLKTFDEDTNFGFFGRKYTTYWGAGNDQRTRDRGVPNYQNIRILVDEETGTLSMNVLGENGHLLSDTDMRIPAKRIAERMQEIMLR